MGDLTEEYRCKDSKSMLNPLRYGRCHTRFLLDNEGWVNIDSRIEQLYDLRQLGATENFIVDIYNIDKNIIFFFSQSKYPLYRPSYPRYTLLILDSNAAMLIGDVTPFLDMMRCSASNNPPYPLISKYAENGIKAHGPD